MPGNVESQTVAGAAQFSGLLGFGLFRWNTLEAAPSPYRVCVTSIGYASEVGAPGDLTVIIRPLGGAPTQRILCGRVLAAEMTGPAGDADANLGGIMIPRTAAGEHWQLEAYTTGKAVTATVTVAWIIQPLKDDAR